LHALDNNNDISIMPITYRRDKGEGGVFSTASTLAITGDEK